MDKVVAILVWAWMFWYASEKVLEYERSHDRRESLEEYVWEPSRSCIGSAYSVVDSLFGGPGETGGGRASGRSRVRRDSDRDRSGCAGCERRGVGAGR